MKKGQSLLAFQQIAHSRKNTCGKARGRKHWALRPQKPLRLIRDGEVGVRNFICNTYSLHCHHQNDSALRWAVVWTILMYLLTLWAKSQNSVHKPQFLKRKDSRSGSNRDPSAYQSSALPLGHTGSRQQLVNPKTLCTVYKVFGVSPYTQWLRRSASEIISESMITSISIYGNKMVSFARCVQSFHSLVQ